MSSDPASAPVPIMDDTVGPLYQRIRGQYPLTRFGLAMMQPPRGPRYLQLLLIEVTADARGMGIGTAVMQDLTSVANDNGWLLALTPDPRYGTPADVLERWYARFGFIPNTGKGQDRHIDDTMTRRPQVVREAAEPVMPGLSRGTS